MKPLTRAHQSLALELLFEEEQQFFKEKEDNFAIEDLRSVGIIQEVGNRRDFVHRTFAEFLVACLVIEKLQKPKDSPQYKELQAFLLKQIFLPRNYVLRQFIEDAVSTCSVQQLKSNWQEICACDLLVVSENMDRKEKDEEESVALKKKNSVLIEDRTKEEIEDLDENEKEEEQKDLSEDEINKLFERLKRLSRKQTTDEADDFIYAFIKKMPYFPTIEL